jgi:hypothetical protein
MSFDVAIVIGFLIATLVVGLGHGRYEKTSKIMRWEGGISLLGH